MQFMDGINASFKCVKCLGGMLVDGAPSLVRVEVADCGRMAAQSEVIECQSRRCRQQRSSVAALHKTASGYLLSLVRQPDVRDSHRDFVLHYSKRYAT
jgi:hypothetical protein